jgi:autotransporter-associated beta strand protein
MQARFLVCFAGLAAGLFSFFSWTSPAPAQAVYTWSAGASGPWDTSDDSWGGEGSNTLWDGVNGPSNVADFTAAGAVATVSGNASVYANGIIFNSPASIGGAALTLASQGDSIYATPTITVNGSGGTIASALAGSSGLVVTGQGTLTLTNNSSYSGGTTVNQGTLALAGGGYGDGTIQGTLTVNPGAAVSLQSQLALGYYGAAVTTVNVNGAVIDNAQYGPNGSMTNFTLTGGTMSASGQGAYDFNSGYGITTYASTATSLISAALTPLNGSSLDFNVASGSTARGVDLEVSGILEDSYNYGTSTNTPAGITKDGPGVMLVSGTGNSINYEDAQNAFYSGPTTVNAGRLILDWDQWILYGNPQVKSQVYTVAVNSTLEVHLNSSLSPDFSSFSITGGGTFVKSGPGTLLFNRYQADNPTYTWAMSPGGLIDVEGGELQVSDYSSIPDFSGNYSSLNIAAGAVFEGEQANVQIDALTGAGTYQGGWYGPRTLTIGAANGSGTFSGTIQGNGTSGYGQPTIYKEGTGTEALTGTLNFHGGYSASTIFVTGGVPGSPSTLVISPTGQSMIGTIDPGNSFGDGGVSIGTNGGDNALLVQTSGTIGAQSLWIGTYGSGTLSIGGGVMLVGTGNLNAAFNNGGSATINVSGGMLGFLNNANAQLGAYYNSPATINQTGGLVAFYSDSGGLSLGGTGGLLINSGGVYTYNLNGGTLAMPAMSCTAPAGGAGGGSGVFNFNGGVLQTTASSSDFLLSADVTTNVEAGGAIINTAGNNVTIANSLISSNGGAPDGGLTVLGGGTLVLSGTNTYNGGTTLLDGELIAAAPYSLEDGSALAVGTGVSVFGTVLPAAISSAAAVTAVPEPGTLALLAAGAAATVFAVRRKRFLSKQY